MVTFEQLRQLIISDRSYRRFDASKPIDTDTLKRLVELTRYCASARNAQPLRYRIVNSPAECARLFPALKWAGYYKDWDGPTESERPTAYLVQCLDTEISTDPLCDDGLHLQAITLGAASMGIHGCIIKAFNPLTVSQALHLSPAMKVMYVLALGYPAEEVILEDIDSNRENPFHYYRDEQSRHHVPKRSLEELIIH